MVPGTRGPRFFQLSLSLAGPPPGHLSDQGSPAAPTPGDPHHKDFVGKGDSLRPSFLPGVPPRRGQLSSAVGATGDFFRHDVPQLARAIITRLSLDGCFRLWFLFRFHFRFRFRFRFRSRLLRSLLSSLV